MKKLGRLSEVEENLEKWFRSKNTLPPINIAYEYADRNEKIDFSSYPRDNRKMKFSLRNEEILCRFAFRRWEEN